MSTWHRYCIIVCTYWHAIVSLFARSRYHSDARYLSVVTSIKSKLKLCAFVVVFMSRMEISGNAGILKRNICQGGIFSIFCRWSCVEYSNYSTSEACICLPPVFTRQLLTVHTSKGAVAGVAVLCFKDCNKLNSDILIFSE